MNLKGKIIVVTGATDGIGKVAARELAKAGASVVIVGRNPVKGERVIKELRAATGHDGVDFVQGDLLTLKGVRGAAEILRGRLKSIDVLLNNAGAAFIKRGVTEDGFEQTFALNHLSYFVMTALLLDLLKAAPAGRVVSVASGAHAGAKLDLSDLQNAKAYSGWRAYYRGQALRRTVFIRALWRRDFWTTTKASPRRSSASSSRLPRSRRRKARRRPFISRGRLRSPA
jgi:retinol dehydrogenase-12